MSESTFTATFDVFDTLPVPVLLGNHTLRDLKSSVSSGQPDVPFSWNGVIPATTNPFKIEVDDTHYLGRDPYSVPLRARETVVIPSNTHSKVFLAALSEGDSDCVDGLSKLITPVGEDTLLRVAWGPTQSCEWAQIANLSPDPIVVRAGDIVARLQCSSLDWEVHDIELGKNPEEDEPTRESEELLTLIRTLHGELRSHGADESVEIAGASDPRTGSKGNSEDDRQMASQVAVLMGTPSPDGGPQKRTEDGRERVAQVVKTYDAAIESITIAECERKGYVPALDIRLLSDASKEGGVPESPTEQVSERPAVAPNAPDGSVTDCSQLSDVTTRTKHKDTCTHLHMTSTREKNNCEYGLDHPGLPCPESLVFKRLEEVGVDMSATKSCRTKKECELLARWCLKPEILETLSKDGKLDFSAPRRHNVTCQIQTSSDAVFKAHPGRENPENRAEILKQVEEKVRQGIVEKSSAPWSSNCVCINKNGKIRIAVDYRKLNALTVKDNYLLPTVQEIVDSLEGTHWFTTVDACQAYHQIPMHSERDRDLTSFIVPGGGLYRYKYMPFGLTNAGAVWTRFIDSVLAGLRWDICLVYADDILIHTKSPRVEDHIKDLDAVFSRLREFNIKVKSDKVKLGLKELPFLGQLVGTEGIRPDPAKTKAVTDLKVPKNVHELRRVMGMFTYYRKFIPHFADIAASLYALCGKNAQNKRNSKEQIALSAESLANFEKLKGFLTQEPIMLRYPDWDSPFEVHCDASDVGVAAKLCQRVNGVERVVMYASKSLTPAEKKYFAYEKEALALVWALDLFKHYLKYKPFVVLTDCRSLVYLKDRAINARIGRWMVRLQEFDFTIKHKAGVLITDVDPISRAPLDSTNPYGQEPMEELYDDVPDKPPLFSKAEEALQNESDQESLRFMGIITPYADAAARACEGGLAQEPFVGVFTRHQTKISSKHLDPVKEKDGGEAPSTTDVEMTPVVEEPAPMEDVPSREKAYFKCPKDLEGWNLETWVSEQGNTANSEVSRLRKYLADKPDNTHYKINSNGLLVKIDENRSRIVVPESLRAFVLRLHHNMPLHGHQGGKRLNKMLSSRFYWANMAKDALRWVQSCSCVKRKTPRPTTQGLTEPVLATYPLDVVGIDLVGKCLETTKGHKWILTIVDHYTRWPIAIPLPDRKADTIARALYEHLISQYGIPRKILSDQGKELIGIALSTLYEKWGIKRVQTGGYNPQANGACERFHRWLHTAMSQLYDRKSPDWDEYIPASLFAYRASVNDATGYSPYFLMHGREPILPSDAIFNPEKLESSTIESYESYVDAVTERLCKALDKTRRTQYESYLANYNRAPERKRPDFKPGDKVLVWRKSTKEARLELSGDQRSLPNKWVNPWTGPGTFIKELSNTSCMVELDGKSFPMNYNRVARFVPWDEVNVTTDKWLKDPDTVQTSDGSVSVSGKYDDVASGDIVLFGLNDGTSAQNTYAVARVLNVNKKNWICFQWMGNYSNSKERVFLPGWIDPKDNKEYYSHKPIHKTHPKFMGEDTGTYTNVGEVLLKGPALIKESGKLTPYALDLISKLEN